MKVMRLIVFFPHKVVLSSSLFFDVVLLAISDSFLSIFERSLIEFEVLEVEELVRVFGDLHILLYLLRKLNFYYLCLFPLLILLFPCLLGSLVLELKKHLLNYAIYVKKVNFPTHTSEMLTDTP